MKARNTLLFFAAVLLLAAGLCGCGSTPKEVTYDALPEQDQVVIDYIFDIKGLWERGCSGAGFESYEGETIFRASYYEKTGPDTYSGWIRWYSFDINRNEFTEIESRYKSYTGYSSSGKTFAPSFLHEWNSSWSDTQKRNYLAQKYDSFLKG